MARTGISPTSRVLLLTAVLLPLGAPAAEVEAYGTTLARYWTQSYPDLSKNRYVPLTQFVGIDATGLGEAPWSLHLFGWGKTDLADQSSPGGKGGGDLTYAYFLYRAPKSNGEVKLGRFAAQGAAGLETVDGMSARADLRGGFTIAVFGGKPVNYDPEGAPKAAPRDFMVGGRLAWRANRYGELGLSYLQDGTQPKAQPALPGQPVLEDHSRKLLGADLRLSPHASFDVSGRVTFNEKTSDGAAVSSGNSRLAGQDYLMSWKLTRTIQFSGNYVERNFKDYYAGTNLPALFRQIETEKYKAHSGLLSFGIGGPLQFSADYRKARREGNGDSSRAGVELRTTSERLKLKSGLAYHRVTASEVPLIGGTVAFYSLSHHETRLWLLHDAGRYYLSLDGLSYVFDDKNNPMLNGEPKSYLGVASLGFRPTGGLTVSGDVSYGMNALYKKEVRGLLRIDFRFGSGGKGGGK